MATKAPETSVAQATFAPFRFAWRVLSSILLMWFVSGAIQIAYVHSQSLAPLPHIQEQLDFYTEGTPENLANDWGASALNLLTVKWPVLKWVRSERIRPTTQAPGILAPMLKTSIWASYKPEIEVMVFNTILFVAKLGVVAGLAPIYVLWLVVFGVDGLVQRYVRRACGGHESASIYHRAKLYGTRLLPPLAALIFLCSPVAFPGMWVFIPSVLISAALIRIQATYYKKYL